MKTLYHLLFISVLFVLGSCEVITPPSPFPSDVFIKYYGGNQDQEGVDLKQTEDNGYILLGDSRSFPLESSSFGDKFLYLIKTDEDGNEQWSKRYPRSDDDPIRGPREAKKILITDDGYLMLANWISPEDDSKIMLVKVNKEGTEMWTKILRQDSTGKEVALDLHATDNGTFLVTGNSTNINTNTEDNPNAVNATDIFYVELDANGDLLESWLTDEIQGFTGSEYGAGIRYDAPFIYIAGTSDLPEEAGFLLVRIQSNGNWKDHTRYMPHNMPAGGTVRANSMQRTPTGDFVCMGYIETDDNAHITVIKINSDLTHAWTWISPNAAYFSNSVEAGGSIGAKSNGNVEVVPDGGYIVSATLDTDDRRQEIELFRLSEEGNLTWSRVFGGTDRDFASAVIPTNDGGFAAIGTNRFDNSMIMLIKTDEYGELIPRADE
jgi:hypothetical protein